jgi:uncharacterized protein (DUF3084 family)
MSDENDLHRRVAKLEDQHEKLLESTNQLTVSTRLLVENVSQLSTIVKELKDLEPRIRAVEIDVNNNKLLGRALTWVAGTVGSTAIIMFLTYLANLSN